MKLALIGVGFVVIGGLATVYHANKLWDTTQDRRRHLLYALCGLICFNIGNNLLADELHDRYK
jgi:hypothetical protein